MDQQVSPVTPPTCAATPPPGRRTVFMLPGQGTQHPRMAAGLYDADETFTDVMDGAFALLDDPALRKVWLQRDPGPLFHDITRAQPLLLSVNYALARTLISRGVTPDAVLGHSVGEIAAAVIADIFDFADALHLLTEFVDHYRHAPAGGMLAVAAAHDDVHARIAGIDDVVIGVINSPRQVLVCGSREGLQHVKHRLFEHAITCADVNALQPFHSPLMNPLHGEDTESHWRSHISSRLRPPRCRVYSAYLGAPLTGPAATDPDYWLGQPARQVRFGPALRAVLTDGPCTLVEVGPGQSLSALARRTPEVASGQSTCVSVLAARRGADDRTSLERALEHLAVASTTTPPDGREPHP